MSLTVADSRPAVLALSILLAALCLFALASAGRTVVSR
jgi:hypothetical protein